MLKKWGPALLLAVSILAILVWARCTEPDVVRHEPISSSFLRADAIAIVGELGPDTNWSGEINEDLLSEMSPEGRAALDIGPDLEKMRRVANKSLAIDLNAHERSVSIEGSTSLIDSIQVLIALIACETVINDRDSAMRHARFANDETIRALETANDIEQWSEASATRLLFIASVMEIAADPGWSPVQRSLLVPPPNSDLHRRSLCHVFKRDLFANIVPKVGEASERSDLEGVVAECLFDAPDETATSIVSALIGRHERAFDPRLTVKAMAGSIKALTDAMTKNWPETERVLDDVARAQQIWVGLDGIAKLETAPSALAVKELKTRIAVTENPVGLALINRERLSWSNYVQSSFVADMKEAIAQIGLSKQSDADSINDPLTGGPFDLTGAKPRSKLTKVGEPYSFIKEFLGPSVP